MKNVLSAAGRKTLRRFAAARVLAAFDFDGTLAPIVAVPEGARMRLSTRRLLEEVAARYPCVVLSGRARSDVRRRLRGVPVREVVGNHGAEPRRPPRHFAVTVRSWRRVLRGSLSAVPGVRVEDKVFSLAIHYRGAPDKRKARAAIRKALRDLPDLRVTLGKRVVNLVPETAPHKGIALERERRRLRCGAAIYVGDDDTDEDVFSFEGGRRLLLGIRVGKRSRSAARFFVRSQVDVDGLLRALIAERSPGRRGPSRSPKKGRPLSGPSEPSAPRRARAAQDN